METEPLSQGWFLFSERQSSALGPELCSGCRRDSGGSGLLVAKDQQVVWPLFSLAFQVTRYHSFLSFEDYRPMWLTMLASPTLTLICATDYDTYNAKINCKPIHSHFGQYIQSMWTIRSFGISQRFYKCKFMKIVLLWKKWLTSCFSTIILF